MKYRIVCILDNIVCWIIMKILYAWYHILMFSTVINLILMGKSSAIKPLIISLQSKDKSKLEMPPIP